MTAIIDLTTTVWVFGLPIMFFGALIAAFYFRSFRRPLTGLLCVSVVYAVFATVSPQSIKIPVVGASNNDWHPESFWYEPWGASIVHRGIDIFAKRGTPVIAPVSTFIFWTGENSFSGKFVIGVDTFARLHFFAHLDEIETPRWALRSEGSVIGTVGASGNARGKQPHLHYGLASLIPRLWLITDQTLGHQRAFYLNPVSLFP